MTLKQAIDVLNPNISYIEMVRLAAELGYATEGWNTKIYRDAAKVVYPILCEMLEKEGC